MGRSVWVYTDRDSQKLIGGFFCQMNQSYNNSDLLTGLLGPY